jgi:5-methylcytosine-specific restriction endonuclease McrA
MKTCTKCNTEQELYNFSRKGRGRSDTCRHCSCSASHNARAKKLGVKGRLTAAAIQARYEYHLNRCYYCHKVTEQLEPDHRIALAAGGSNQPANIVPACKTCNRSKGAKTLEAWDSYRELVLGHDLG